MNARVFLSTFLTIAMMAAVACGLPLTAHATDGAWEASTIGEHEYYSLERLRNFYKLTTPAKKKKVSTEVSILNSAFNLRVTPGSREILIGGYRCRLMHPVQQREDGELLISKTDYVKLIDPILRPTYIPERRNVQTVIIDPGHGGTDYGNKSPLITESLFTLQLAQELAASLEKQGLQVVLTRHNNGNLSDAERVKVEEHHRDAIFISIHLNSGRSDVFGIETYTATPQEPNSKAMQANRYDAANAALAFALHSHAVNATKAPDRAVRRAYYTMLNTVTCPAAMVMVGYATNKDEATQLLTEEYRANLVQGLTQGVLTFKAAISPSAQIVPPPPSATPAPAVAEPVKPNSETSKTDKTKKTQKTSSSSSTKKPTTSSNKTKNKNQSSGRRRR